MNILSYNNPCIYYLMTMDECIYSMCTRFECFPLIICSLSPLRRVSKMPTFIIPTFIIPTVSKYLQEQLNKSTLKTWHNSKYLLLCLIMI